MGKRKAPYQHADGGNCWTENCRIRLGKNTNTGFKRPDNATVKLPAKVDTVPVLDKKTGVTLINTIAPLEAFEKATKDGRLISQTHPEYPYRIYKYSILTQYRKDWDEVTMAARGLIVNHETGEIVARPFEKFFNHNEGLTPEEDLTGPFRVAEKMDGSLGILYAAPDGELEITTSGGFSAVQAKVASEIYQAKYNGNWEPNPELTYMYEIIYPSNRIVVDYHEERDIYLLGAVNKGTGRSVPLEEITEWKWKRAKEYDNFDNLTAVVNAPDPGIKEEGYVVHFLNSDRRIKFKHQEYLQVHRIATGVNSRRIHDLLASGMGDQIDDFRKNVPEEFIVYVDDTRADLENQFNTLKSNYEQKYAAFAKTLPKDASKKDKAIAIQKAFPESERAQMFSMMNGQGVDTKSIWRDIRPPFEKGFWATGSGIEPEDEEKES